MHGRFFCQDSFQCGSVRSGAELISVSDDQQNQSSISKNKSMLCHEVTPHSSLMKAHFRDGGCLSDPSCERSGRLKQSSGQLACKSGLDLFKKCRDS